jgi:hypothetical protein
MAEIKVALEPQLTSLEMSDYHDALGLEPEWVAYLDELAILIRLEYDTITVKQNGQEISNKVTYLSDNVISTVQLEERRRMQNDTVQSALTRIRNNAKATAMWEEQVNQLRTPSSTPIMLPSATEVPATTATPQQESWMGKAFHALFDCRG